MTEMMEKMASMIAEFPLVNCTGCNYCMPCPFGIDIPGIFAHYNSMVTEGSVGAEEGQKEFKRLRKRYLTTYNKAIPTVRQADHCIGCGQCMRHCPQSIAIPKELHRIDRQIEALKRTIK